MKTKVCFISIVGRPNVGKSTLLNNVLAYELAIATPMAQTTRDQILGIYSDQDFQFVFCDTPGIHIAEDKLGENLNSKSFNAISENDLIFFLHPLNEKILSSDLKIIEKIKKVDKPKFAIITKIDLAQNPQELLERQQFFSSQNFDEILGYTNKNSKAINLILNTLKKYAYESAFFYSEDEITDKSILFLAKELIRESCIFYLRQEIPHSIAIEITSFLERNQRLEIEANIICNKESQKKIIIGKNASMIKQIGIKARKNIEKKFDTKLYLKLNVKFEKNWKKNLDKIRKYGY